MPDPNINTTNTDPTLVAPIPTGVELGEKVKSVIGFFNEEFGLNINGDAVLDSDPTPEQLAALHNWHKDTCMENGIDMPDFDTFTAKVILAKALMPQVDKYGEVQYLFGKGVGVELALQGEVKGRAKQHSDVPIRTHSDFEIYGAATDKYDSIEHSDRFRAVFGNAEIYPVTDTKGLHSMPKDLLHRTSETVDFGGVSFLVPNLELQFIDKFEKGNEELERELRTKTDAEWLASTYKLDGPKIHSAIDHFVIKPEIAKFQAPEDVAKNNLPVLLRKIDGSKRIVKEDSPDMNDADLESAVSENIFVKQYCKNNGIANVSEIIDIVNGTARESAVASLTEAESNRQAKITKELNAKHQEVNEVLAQVA